MSTCSPLHRLLRLTGVSLCLGLLVSTSAQAADAPATPRFAVVRSAKAIADSRAAKQLDQTFQAKLADVRAQIARKQEVRGLLVKRFQDVQADYAKATEAKDEAAARAAREKSEQVAASVQDADREIATLNNDQALGAWLRGEQAKLAELANQAIRAVGRRHHCQLVLDASLLAPPGVNAIAVVDPTDAQTPPDLTDEVLAEINLTFIDAASPPATR